MYFDAVTNRDGPLRLVVHFNGTPEEVQMWLEQNQGNWAGYLVWYGKTLKSVTPEQYLKGFTRKG